jgi:hypothetical protein
MKRIELSDIIGGYLVTEVYFGYTMKEAKALFGAKYKGEAK